MKSAMPTEPSNSVRPRSKAFSPSLIRWLGWIATLTAMSMFLSYIDQIRLNLAGARGSILLPLATALNCGLWTTYGTLRRDWPVALGNIPGVVLGAITFLTAL